MFAHIPLWTVYPDWGWGTDDGAQALSYLKRFGSVTVLNGHIHQVMQKVEGNVTFHTARSTAFPQPAPGAAPSPGPMKVPDDQLRNMLGIANVTFKQNEQRLAIIDTPLGRLRSLSWPSRSTTAARWSPPRLARPAPRCWPPSSCPAGRKPQPRPAPCRSTISPSGRQRLTVKAGTTVTWTNKDDIPHGIASTEQCVHQIEGDGHRRQLFVHLHHAGTYQYFCYIHPHMIGTIVVEAATGSNATQ